MKKIKMKNLVIMLIVLGMFSMSSCSKEDLFEQPTIEVTGYSLLELPGEYTNLEIDMLVTNNDSREANIADVEYQVVIEGITSELEEIDIDQKILVGTPLELTLPLTLVTKDAIQLLAKLDAGVKLNYVATGTFHVDDPILNLFDLPINITGTATVDAGFEDFYDQPEVTVDDITITSAPEGTSDYTYEFDVACTVQNMDSRDVTIDELEYIVYIEGFPSETHFYSDSYSNDFSIAGGASESLNLPVTLILNSDESDALADAIASGTVEYRVEGTFHAIEVDGAVTDFLLPLYVSGNVEVEDLFEQPEITVNDISGTYTIDGFPTPTGYTFNLDVNTTVENMDSRDVVIDELEYVVDVEGILSDTHWYSDTYSTDISIAGGGIVSLTLPVTLNLSLAEGAALASDLADGFADYIIEGTFHAIEVNGAVVNFLLPLYDTGSTPVTVVGP